MLFKETVEPKTFALIKELLAEPFLGDFMLVGGTALSLQIGHRVSVDIDLFSNEQFNSSSLAHELSKRHPMEGVKTLTNGVFCFINDIKVDIMSHQYSWLGPPIVSEGVRMVSMHDIGAMKLHAIVQNGSRLKDFVDVYALLQHVPLNTLLNGYVQKYPLANKSIAVNALLYHNDVKPATINFVGKAIQLDQIAERLRDAIVNGQKVYASESVKTTTDDQPSRKRKRGRRI